MNYRIIRYIMGIVSGFGAVFLLLPCLVAIIYHEMEGFTFLTCAGVMMLVGLCFAGKKPKETEFYAREGLVVVALSWSLISLIGAVPYVTTGSIPNVIDALFESVSGFTTTGSSILATVEQLPRCVAFWRCFTNWIGGMGVLVFIMAVLPYLGARNLYLMKAESTGPSVGKMLPKMQSNAFLLYAIYIGMTIVEMILLLLCGMPVFDAVCDSLATAGTGGFAVRTDSIGSYSSTIQIIIAIFMLLFGINFKFYFLLLTREIKEAFKMEEVRWYLIIYAAAVILITIDITGDVGKLALNLRDVVFQVATIMTSTGFSTADFCQWPEFSQTVLVLLMCIGGCAGSTAGGIKISRIILYVKSIKKELEFQLHPRSVRKIKMDGKAIDHETLRSTKAFLLIYIMIAVVSLLIISLDKFDLVTNFTAVITMLNNIGPGLGLIGPTGNFAGFSDVSKCVMMFDMLAGRLEVVPMIVLLTPWTWKRQ